MTARRAAVRRRRSAAAGDVPRAVAEWFAGVPRAPRLAAVPWAVQTFPGRALLPDWWAAWSKENPGVTPPASAAWLADPEHPRQRVPAWLLAMARKVVPGA